MNAIDVTNVSKIYRRYSRRRQFATLKSALLSRSLIRDLRPDETFAAVRDVTFDVRAGQTLGVIGRNGSGKSTLLKLVAGITKPTTGTRRGERAHLGADRARRRLSSRDLRPRERLHQRHHARSDEARDHATLRRDRRVRRDEGLHRRAGQDVLVRHVHAARLRGGDSRRSRRAPGGRSAGGRRRGLHAQVPRQVRGVQAPRQDDPPRDPLARPGRALLRRGALDGWRSAEGPRRPEARGRRLHHRRRRRRGTAARKRRCPGAGDDGGGVAR